MRRGRFCGRRGRLGPPVVRRVKDVEDDGVGRGGWGDVERGRGRER